MHIVLNRKRNFKILRLNLNYKERINFTIALDPLSLISVNRILQLKSKRMITKYLSWRSQLKGIYENSRLMLIWQSRCRIPILLVRSTLVHLIRFLLSLSLAISLSLSLSLLLNYLTYVLSKVNIIRQLAFFRTLISQYVLVFSMFKVIR